MRAALPLIGLALLAACGSRSDDAGVSPEEDRLLNEAAASIDANTATPDNVVDANMTDPGNVQ